MGSSARTRPTLQRAVKARQPGEAKKAHAVSSVPVKDKDGEIEQGSTPATTSNKRARTSVVQPQGSASFADHDGARDPDFSLSDTSSLSSLSTLSGPFHDFGSASSQIVTPQSQVAVLSPGQVASCENVSSRPHKQPKIWAEERQNLCEALPYYRSYQSGSYTHDGLAYGFLLDKDCGERSYMDEEIVITRAGGGCSANDNGTLQQSGDQSRSAPHIAAFFNNKELGVPVGLIVGSSNASCPTQIPHRYCVMDWFQVTHIWPEKSNRKTCFKFRFEKLDLKSKSWWAPLHSPEPPMDRDFKTKTACHTCVSCTQESVQVFQQAWICLNETCILFWTVNGSEPPAGLTYNPTFLTERSPWPSHNRPPFPLMPEPFKVDPGHPELSYSRASWKGMVCPLCGRCNSRTKWRELRCATQDCGFWQQIQLTTLSPMSVLPDHGVELHGNALPHDRWDRSVITSFNVQFLGHWRIQTYEISSGNIITHFHSNGPLNRMAGGAHDMFRALQEADIGLQRFPLTSSPVQGEMLTKHFATNYGMPYKYIVAVDSKSFSEAPQVIMDGLEKLTWAGRRTVSDVNGATYKECNELLALGYLESQSIKYHDDGEKDLGPTIATLSLGGDAVMTVRMKENFHSAKKHVFTNPVLRGCQLYDERIQLNADHAHLSPAEFAGSKARFDDKVRNLKKRHSPSILSMRLKQGDMVVMHGDEVQKYYEHQVVPQGKLRFALTTRFVKPENIPENERWKGDFQPFSETRYNKLERIDDADSAIAVDTPTQSSSENSVADASIVDDKLTVDNKSTFAGHVSFNHTSDIIAVDAHAQKCSVLETAVFDAHTTPFSAPEQTNFDTAYPEFPLYNDESTYLDTDALRHPFDYIQPFGNANQDHYGFETVPDTML